MCVLRSTLFGPVATLTHVLCRFDFHQLEDQVAELLATSDGQKSENENLRDLLARLQKENVMVSFSSTGSHLPSIVS